MTIEKWVGITVTGEGLNLVSLEFREGELPSVLEDLTWNLQTGDRPASYNVMYERILNYLRENCVKSVVIKESAVSQNTRLSHLLSAELRGVVMAAASAASSDVKTIKKSLISRTFGQRKADEYVSDDVFWNSSLKGSLRKGSRETALVVIATKRR